MTDTPKVSVLLPVRNGAPYLSDALDSLVRQSLQDIEILVVDDGSDDATPEILEEWQDRDARIRIHRQAPTGIVAALERGRRAARGPYLARMDADDVSEPERLERQLAFLESRADLAGCGSRMEYVPREALKDGARRYERWINSVVTPEAIAADIFVECPVPHPTFFLRASLVDEIGGYRDRGWPEDYDLVLRLWEAGHRLGKVPETLLRWRESPDRLSRVDETYSHEAFRRCKVHFLRRTLLKGRPGVVIWGAGPTGKAFGRELSRQGGAILAWVDLDPRKIGQEIHGAPVLSPDRAGEVAERRELRRVGRPGESGAPRRNEEVGDRSVGDGSAPLHLGAVAQVGARREIRAAARDLGLEELEDFAVVA